VLAKSRRETRDDAKPISLLHLTTNLVVRAWKELQQYYALL
jgi:hypothetical protein